MPEVTRTGTGRRVAFAIPKAKNPASRSSIRVCNLIRFLFANSASCQAIGADREPGQRTASVMPISNNDFVIEIANSVDGFTTSPPPV